MREEMLYDQSSLAIALVLLALILVANEFGFRVGQRVKRSADTGLKTQTNAIQAGMLGLLALLLGFTFSMALQRYDSRSDAVIAEANAIGTALLRSALLAEPFRPTAETLIDAYIALRIETSRMDLTRVDDRNTIAERTAAVQADLWSNATQAAAANPNPVTTGLYVQALNDIFDARDARNAILDKHVPELVLLLLFGVFITGSSTLGYASGLAGRRPILATTFLNLLVVLVVFIIVDLDRPKRGLIQVDQSVLHALAR